MTEVFSHIIHQTKEDVFLANSAVLYFFCSTARKAQRVTSLTYTLLRQVVSCSSTEKANSIAAAFLGTLVDRHFQRPSPYFMEDSPVDTIIQKIVRALDNELIEALEEAFQKAGIRELLIIVDGLWEGVAGCFVRHIMDSELLFKVLLTCQHNSLQNVPDGMLCIEYDKERQGMHVCYSTVSILSNWAMTSSFSLP